MHDALEGSSPAYQLFILVLSVFALLFLALEAVFRLDPEMSRILQFADDVICVIFLIDFCLSLARAPKKWRYFATWGWLDLLSAVPLLDAARWARLARIARLSRVLRALRAGRLMSRMLFKQRGQTAALAAALLALFLIIGSSAAILRFENLPGSNITTADDAIWWAFTTITTVGYGDRYPVSGEGRFIAALLMTAGVGLFGAFSAALATWFLAPDDEATDAELALLRGEIAELRKVIEERLPANASSGGAAGS